MNYLAHAYLSFDNPEILTGNLISDFVKGKKKFDYPQSIQKGIALHRAIDSFTDGDDTTRRAKVPFRDAYGLYAGALIDVVYDHFLANDPELFPVTGPDVPEPLADFSEKTYEQLAPFSPLFPDRFARMFPYMRTQNWLYNYRFKEGIYSSFAGLARRAAYMPDPAPACRIFDAHYPELEACYQDFFPRLLSFARSSLQTLLEDPGGN